MYFTNSILTYIIHVIALVHVYKNMVVLRHFIIVKLCVFYQFLLRYSYESWKLSPFNFQFSFAPSQISTGLDSLTLSDFSPVSSALSAPLCIQPTGPIPTTSSEWLKTHGLKGICHAVPFQTLIEECLLGSLFSFNMKQYL